MTDSLDLTRYSFQTNDLDELRQASEWDQQYFQMVPGEFDGGIDLMQVGTTHIFRERWGRRIRYRGTAPVGSYGFALPLAHSGDFNWVGQNACSDTVAIQAPEQEADLLTADSWDALTLAVSDEDVRATVSAMSGQDELWDGLHGVAKLAPDAAARLRNDGARLLSMADPANAQDAALLDRHADQFVKIFLWNLIGAQEAQTILIQQGSPEDIVRRATDFVLSQHYRVIGLVDICEYLNVKLRNLHYAFQEITGMAPATWLRRMRLNWAHERLLVASPSDIGVKQVALELGFLHMGHFGQEYKKLFGQTPRQTLIGT